MRFGAVAFSLLLTTTALAQNRLAKVDVKLLRALDSGLSTMGARLPSPGRAPAVIELQSPATPSVLRQLHKTGASLREIDGRALSYRRFVAAEVTANALPKLQALSVVKAVWLSPAAGPVPLDHSGALVGLAAGRGARPALDLLTGAGTTVADLDANVDVFHPSFFRGDAGYYDWIDVNADQVFTPGVDAVDLDRDGQASPAETAMGLKAETYSYLTGGDLVPERGAEFDPALDWIFLDENASGQREFGSKAGFDDSALAFGEPLFVPDDVNQNGSIDVGERFVRLGTSKFRKVQAKNQDGSVNHVFERGVDLAQLDTTYPGPGGSAELAPQHGTMTLSIVAGDAVLGGRRWVGMAPDAELVLTTDRGDTAAGLIWALGEKPDAVLFELSPWVGQPLDGSDVMSSIVDDSTKNDGVTHACAMGNMADSFKHTRTTLTTQGELGFQVPDSINGQVPYFVGVSLNARGGTASAVLTEPGGTLHPLTTGTTTLSNGAVLFVSVETTSRGTHFTDVILYTQSPSAPIPVGDYKLALTPSTTGVVVDGYVFDDASSWGVGAKFVGSAVTNASTFGVPATSDHCIGVAAHTGHYEPNKWWFNYYTEDASMVRDYSGRGPRIDGAQKPDLAAPDNPWSALAHGAYPAPEFPHGAMMVGGGTSAATPHVTGVAALLAQADIRGDAAIEALRKGAIADGKNGQTPNPEVGYGRLSIAGAFGVSDQGAAPSLELTATPPVAALGKPITLTATATDPNGELLEIKWDDDYDGTWDVGYAALANRDVVSAAPARRAYKARVRDASGRIDEAVVWVEWNLNGGGGNGGGNGNPGGGSSDSGCGCRTAGSTGSALSLSLALMALALGVARRRRKS